MAEKAGSVWSKGKEMLRKAESSLPVDKELIVIHMLHWISIECAWEETTRGESSSKLIFVSFKSFSP